MYHLRDAAPIERSELKTAIWCSFVRRDAAPPITLASMSATVSLSSPRSGREIKITSLNEEYWQRHYVGARRVMTPKTIR